MKKRSLRVFMLIWAAVMVAILSSTATLLMVGHAGARETRTLMVSPDEYQSVQRYSRLDEVRETLMNTYYQELDESTLLLGAIRGMTAAVQDPYTFYYTPEEMTQADEDAKGAYHGIGVLIQSSAEGYIQILRVYPNTPAEASGLLAGDLIIGLDGEPISGEDGRAYNEAVSMIRGESGSRVLLTVLRDGETLEISVARADVNISYADWQILPDDIGYISLTQFTGDAAERFTQALGEFKAAGVSGLVIDLRGNPGGLLDQVIDIADQLLPAGTIMYAQGRDGERHDYYSDEEMYDVPLAVLVNGQSASASEILAASVQAFGRGRVVGLTTYGKGVVQTLLTFDEDGAGIQLTTASYYDGDGRVIHGKGVEPDIQVALEGESVPLNPDPVSDNQLAAALAEVKRQIVERALQPQDS